MQQQQHRSFLRAPLHSDTQGDTAAQVNTARRGEAPCLLILIRHGVCRLWRSPPGRRLCSTYASFVNTALGS